MTFIVPFQEEFCQEIHTVYYVNEDKQHAFRGSVTTSEKCPHCNERHIFKVFEPKSVRDEEKEVVEIYDCKCPTCRKTFNLEVEYPKEDEFFEE